MAWQGGAVPGGRGERVGGARAHCQGSHTPVVYLTCLVSGAMGWFPARPPAVRFLRPASWTPRGTRAAVSSAITDGCSRVTAISWLGGLAVCEPVLLRVPTHLSFSFSFPKRRKWPAAFSTLMMWCRALA